MAKSNAVTIAERKLKKLLIHIIIFLVIGVLLYIYRLQVVAVLIYLMLKGILI